MNGSIRLTALAATLVSTALVGQESVSTLLGTVSDGKGKPLAGALVTIAGVKLPIQRSLRTNERGEYRIPLLPPGDYVLRVSKDGFNGAKAEMYIQSGQIARQDLRLSEIKVAEAQVEVVATAATVDKTETRTASTVSIDALQSLPLGLNSYAAIALSPGVTGSTAYPVIRGGIPGQTQFMVNGISVRDSAVRQGRQFEVVIDDLTEDVSVIQSPLNAKNGFVSGGIVNLVTKTGTNKFEGSFRAKLYRSSWSTQRGPVPARYGTANTLNSTSIVSDDLQRTYEITLLGPIIKDHLTFAYANRISPTTYQVGTTPNMVTGGFQYVPYGGTAVFAYTYGVPTSGPNVGQPVVTGGEQYTNTQQYKLFWLITPTNQVEVFYTDDKLGPYYDIQYNNYDPTAANNQSSKRPFYGINYRGTIGSQFMVDVRYGLKRSDVYFSSGPGDSIYQRVYNSSATTIFNTGTTLGTILTGGDPWRPVPERRQSETTGANLNWFNGTHNVDVGFEQLKETNYSPESSGPNRRIFYVPGRLADGRYMVYNYVGSPAQGNATYSNNTGYVPEYRTFQDGGGGDSTLYSTTNSLYVNDQWILNGNWIVMGGLRFDQWKIKDRGGERINSSALSPRFQVKYDLAGNNKDVLSFSHAYLRGTIGNGNLGGTFIRRPGNQIVRRFWNAGTVAPYLVDEATLKTPANYGFVYSIQDNDYLYDVNPGLKPEVTIETTVGFTRNFSQGGFFKATAIHRRFKDLWYARGINAVVNIPDFTGQAQVTPTGFKQVLDFDPYGRRNYRGIETEWALPIKVGRSFRIDLNGSYTMNRLYSTETWREGNVANSTARFDDLYKAAGMDPGVYNPYGELPTSLHNVAKAWVTVRHGATTGIRNEFSLLGRYTSGAPYSLANPWGIPAGTLVTAPGMPTTVNQFYNGRGRFTGPDYYTFDLQWNVFIPLTRGIQFYSYLSVNNLFNTRFPTGINRGSSGTIRPVPDPNPTFQATTLQNFGVASGTQGGRGLNIDVGFRF